MSLLPLEPLQKLIDIGMMLGYYGVEATVPSFKYIVRSGLIGNSTLIHIPEVWWKKRLFPYLFDFLRV